MFDYAHWDMPLDQKLSLTTLYGPYVALCKSGILSQSSFLFKWRSQVADLHREAAFMGIDMVLRLRGIINRSSSASLAAGGKKTQ
jgi:hypothetical protein